jgi:hypothetical protein
MNCSALIKVSIAAVLALSACAPEFTKGFHKTGTAAVAAQDLYPFWTPEQTQLFTMEINFRKHHFSGLLLVKQTADGHSRIVFNTHFGMGVFDFEFTRDSFHVHSCLELLDRRRVLKLLEEDFRTLLLLDVQSHNNTATVYHTPADSTLEVNRIGGRYYLKNIAQKTLLKIKIPHCFISGYYSFTNYIKNFPEKMTIKHSGIGLQMVLEKIHRTTN